MKFREQNDYDLYYREQNSRSSKTNDQTKFNEVFDLLTANGHVLNFESRVLDIGCRTGNLVAEFITYGHNACGIDIGEEAEKQWKRLPANVQSQLKRADIHEGIPFKGKFDLIVMSHVLEHVYDPIKVLDIVKSAMHEKSILFVRVPLDYQDRGMRHTPHYIFFETQEEFAQFFNDNGFDAKLVQRRFVGEEERTVIAKIK